MAGLKVPPNNEEAEQSVLGAVLIDKDAIATVSSLISSADFYNPVNGMIFDAMLSLYEKGKPIDILTLRTAIKKNKNFKDFEQSYLTELINVVPTAANIEHYAVMIKDALLRKGPLFMQDLLFPKWASEKTEK
jgi:replicative DNA helicase